MHPLSLPLFRKAPSPPSELFKRARHITSLRRSYGCTQRGGGDQQQPRAAGTRRVETSRKRGRGDHKEQSPAPKKKRKKEAHQRSRITIRINAAATLTEIRGMYMGGAHHDVGSLSRKRYTQYVGQQPKGHWGNSENTGGDPHGRRQGRECVCTNGAAGRQTQLEELKNTNTRGARQLESRLDLHARGTKGGHRRAFSGIWLRGLSPAGKVLTGCSACGYATRCARAVAPSGPKTPI